MNRVANISSIPREYMDDPEFETKLKTVMVGKAVGSEKLYVNMDYVKPGAASAKYHSHTRQEEFFLILAGQGLLRMDGEERAVGPGDVVAKPAGKRIAHQFINTGSEILQILDVGTVEPGDVVEYPEENTVLLKDSRLVFSTGDALQEWTSDPNE